MRTVGIDVGSQPSKTAAAVIDWDNEMGVATIANIDAPLHDQDIVAFIRDPEVDKIGIDVPLGWPNAFVQAINQRPWPGPPWTANSNVFTHRTTDHWIQQTLHFWPRSVSTDWIAWLAMRIAALLPANVNRAGDGKVVEVYPRAALQVWGLQSVGYKGIPNQLVLANNVSHLRRSLKCLSAGNTIWTQCLGSDDAFDTVIASLVARAYACGHVHPVPNADVGEAQTEGWITVPLPGSLAQLCEC